MSRLNGFIPLERAADNSFQLQLIESAQSVDVSSSEFNPA